MALERYRNRRDFGRTPEPSGEAAAGEGRRFVVQKHAARRLHYDLRLELDGVLKSWAVPKGPSLDPAQRRLAVHVEDHPIEYGDFEGVIPKGEYGAGPVMLWDRGTWEPEGDPRRDYEKGHLRFHLHGQRLNGRWSLVRAHRAADRDSADNWLLIKGDDPFASDQEATAWYERSVVSDRSMEEIAAGVSGPKSRRRPRLPPPPQWLPPQLATAVERPPEGGQWLHEIKLDGYRTLCRIHNGRATLLSRSGKDWTGRFGALARALQALPVSEAWLDGEVAVLNPDGTSSFPALQRALSEDRQEELVYFLFDLLFIDGRGLTDQALSERKRRLFELLERQPPGPSPLRYCDHVVASGALVYEEACRLGLEGIVSKRADGHYVGRRTRDWQKAKCLNRQEFVIGGYTEPRGGRQGFGALLVGYYEGEALRFAGRVGTGFDERTLNDVYRRLRPLVSAQCPFSSMPPQGRGAIHWVDPVLVAEVAFAGWTGENLLRMASFQGLREDKPAREVVREEPRAPPAEPAAPRPPSRLPGTVAGLRLSNPDKVLWAGQGVTKRQLAAYYESVAEAMLAELSGRPLTLLRCPDGRHGDCFFQKHANESVPAAINRVPLTEKEKRRIYMAVDSLAGIIGLVQLGVLEIHTWGARADRPERPDRMIFDLDPAPDVPWDAVMEGACDVRALLEVLGLRSYVRTTGGKGLHVVVPLVRRHGWEEVKAFSRACAETLVRTHRGKYTARLSKSAREGRIYIDYLRNSMGATAICNYSTRARDGAPVATPVHWSELTPGFDPKAFTVTTVPPRVAAPGADPWPGFYDLRQSLTAPMRHRLGLP